MFSIRHVFQEDYVAPLKSNLRYVLHHFALHCEQPPLLGGVMGVIQARWGAFQLPSSRCSRGAYVRRFQICAPGGALGAKNLSRGGATSPAAIAVRSQGIIFTAPTQPVPIRINTQGSGPPFAWGPEVVAMGPPGVKSKGAAETYHASMSVDHAIMTLGIINVSCY